MKKKVQFLRGAVFAAILFAAVLSCGGGGDGGDSPNLLGAGWTPEYAIGDTGPGGGKIFYVSAAGFPSNGKTCHYLEANGGADLGPLPWATEAYKSINIAGALGWDIGMGYANTTAITTVDPGATAARACKNYNDGGLNDWFLPSRDELNELYLHKNVIGDSIQTYWSSTHSLPENALIDRFNIGGNIVAAVKTEQHSVRAIRAF
ncbi:hypothetical protein AGMMS50230_08590 [Spirochaetia bacterium]|nr:hypothetical protein AGMMS50230_08590 [Spirochaetia bacterium]